MEYEEPDIYRDYLMKSWVRAEMNRVAYENGLYDYIEYVDSPEEIMFQLFIDQLCEYDRKYKYGV